MLKLFGRRYVDYDEVLSIVNYELEFNKEKRKYYEEMSVCDESGENLKKIYLDKRTEYLHKYSEMVNFKIQLNNRFGKT